MARIKRNPAAEQKQKFRCRDCVHSYDWHSKALDGSDILCRCKLDERTAHGKWSKFLDDWQCENFKLK